jgi:uncharacterized protein (DUF1015 family)
MTTARDDDRPDGLSLTPLRALRPAVSDERLAGILCPPYDVIDGALRDTLLDTDADNAVAVVLPDPTPAGYQEAARRLTGWIDSGLWRLDPAPAMYVYEMSDGAQVTRGLLGAVELRAPEDGVILPHENTMAGPVADRLQVMEETGSDLEPIYLVYDGGGAASQTVRAADAREPIAATVTPDGLRHRLWSVPDAADHAAIAADLRGRKALIADGHHRYATYRERQRRQRATAGAGPWDRGLALLVDSSDYGPQVHAIHRVVHGRSLADAVAELAPVATVTDVAVAPAEALAACEQDSGFAVVLTDGDRTVVVADSRGRLRSDTEENEPLPALAALDVSTLHRVLVQRYWNLPDDVEHVGYAHSIEEAVRQTRTHGGFAVLLRPTPVAAVAAVAAAGGRMPRKSTLFTPKPASGLVIRRLADQLGRHAG